MARDKLTEYSATASENTVCGDVNIAENSALPSDMNNFAREVMSHLKNFSDGTDAIDALTVTGDLTVDTNTLHVDAANNRVGVGTASPSQTLETAGNIFINSSGNPSLEIKTSGAGNNPFLRFKADTNYWDAAAIFSNSGDDLFLQYNGSTKVGFPSAGGITFNGDTAAANALDDYEEGTWTPTFTASDTGNNPTITYSHQTGKYVKVGALVHIDVYIRTTAVTGTTGGTSAHRLRMDGLPFQADSQGSASSSFSNLDGMSNGAQIQVSNGSSRCVIKELDGDVNNNDMFTNDLGTGSDDNQLFFSLTYRTDS